MKEAYCSYEVSKLLKEKGFDEPSFAYYSEFDDWKTLRFWRKHARNPINTFYLCAPTHQMAYAWLREKHNILIIPRWVYDNGNSLVVYGYTIFKVFPLPYKDYSSEPIWYIEYNEAIEAALKYVLENLI